MYHALFLSLAALAIASPTPLQVGQSTTRGALASPVLGILPTKITDTASAKQAANFLYGSMSNGTVNGSAIAPLVSQIFLAVEPTSTPTSIPDAQSRVASAFALQEGVSVQDTESAETSEDFFANVLGLLLNGFQPSDFAAVVAGIVS